MAIDIRPVKTRHEQETFLTFPWRIYRGDPIWVPPLLPERRKVLDPARGTFFQRSGYAQCFVAWDGSTPTGTICAAEDTLTNAQRGLKDGMFGFFECINDANTARSLLDTAAAWLRARGLQTLYGPFNLDYEDSYGVLLEGRDRPPALLCGHTPPYYQAFMEDYGMQPARGDNLAFALELDDSPALRQLEQAAVRARRHPTTRIRGARFDRWDEEIGHVHLLMNKALAHLPDFIPWQRQTLVDLFEPFRKIADPELILFAEVNGETIGFLPGIPDLNAAFKHANGLRYPWNVLPLLWYLRRQPACLTVKSILVLREHWGSSAVMLLMGEMLARARARGYRWVDLSLTSADNPRTPILAERLGARIYKRYRVYRKAI
jgi:hypothetical protein